MSSTSIGLIEGSYTWTWGAPGAAFDSLTFEIVPSPGAAALLALLFLLARQIGPAVVLACGALLAHRRIARAQASIEAPLDR